MSPAPLKAIVGAVFGVVPVPVLLGRQYRNSRKFVGDAQWWSQDRSLEYQTEQLRRICTLAYEKTNYYRTRFDREGIHPSIINYPEDMRKFPTIDKSTLREHGMDMMTVPSNSGGMDYVATGGSSGEPLRFYINAERSSVEYAHLVASWQRVGYELDIPQAVIRGQIVTQDRDGLWHDYDPILRRHYYSNFHMTDENMARYVEHIRSLGPCFLHVYPSSVSALTRFIDREHVEPPSNVRGVLSGSETIYPEDRAMVERVWGIRYFSWYGHSEKLVLASECEHSSDYHVWPTYGYFELLDDDGHRITTPGQRGEIVGTGFINTVTPFIRYRTGDYATYVADRCEACGRQHPVIRDIEGRWPSGALVTRDLDLVSMTALNVHDDTFENVKRYQFYQDTPGQAVVRVVPRTSYGENDTKKIIKTLTRRLNDRVSLTVEILDDIPLTPRGKAVWVDQRLHVQELRAAGQNTGTTE